MKYTNGQQIAASRDFWDGLSSMPVIYDDGGREAAGFKGSTRDCVCRSIAIATGIPYRDVYDSLNDFASMERPRKKKRSSARDGVHIPTIRKFMLSIGWTWTPTMKIGSGCKVHLVKGELPEGRLIVSVSKHMTAVIDGVIHDTHDPQRQTLVMEGGNRRIAHRCVYGYYTKGE